MSDKLIQQLEGISSDLGKKGYDHLILVNMGEQSIAVGCVHRNLTSEMQKQFNLFKIGLTRFENKIMQTPGKELDN
jgi:hypothetical protein